MRDTSIACRVVASVAMTQETRWTHDANDGKARGSKDPRVRKPDCRTIPLNPSSIREVGREASDSLSSCVSHGTQRRVHVYGWIRIKPGRRTANRQNRRCNSECHENSFAA